MDVVVKLLFLAFLATVTVASVRLLVIQGLDIVSTNLNLNYKTKGQILGYATSLPELVVVISSALSGVFEAGFWNIFSSNVINWFLFIAAVLTFKQLADLRSTSFYDEIIFGIVSVFLPLALFFLKVKLTLVLAIGLLLFFALYKILDRFFNPKNVVVNNNKKHKRSTLLGFSILVMGIVIIMVTGKYLGLTAKELITEIGTPSWLVGWILGFVTSIPEFGAFFEIYRIHKNKGTLHLYDDTQEALDTLVSSNMCNLGIILPIGMLVFVLL